MKVALSEIVSGFNSLLIGMRITLTEFFKPAVTVHYPHQSLKMAPRYRGHIELVCDESTGRPICVACKACEKACPSDCILVEGEKREGEKRRSVTVFTLDFTKCSLCGSCVESCKSDAIRYSKEYNLAGLQRETFHYDLVERAKGGAR